MSPLKAATPAEEEDQVEWGRHFSGDMRELWIFSGGFSPQGILAAGDGADDEEGLLA
jgi:hypothetical protein